MLIIEDIFQGEFLTSVPELSDRLSKIKAYIFDWDGVFNNGWKDNAGSSAFNEVDSMGTNLLRFHHFLRTGKLPYVSIISGENNQAAHKLAQREHFHAVYSGIKYKPLALDHLLKQQSLRDSEVFFMFDDVLDLALATRVGVKIMTGRKCYPLLKTYVKDHSLADYITYCGGDQSAVREATELIMASLGSFSDTIEARVNFSESYQQYLSLRQKITPVFYHSEESRIIEIIL